jgi:catechol 2,3-dioxygenase
MGASSHTHSKENIMSLSRNLEKTMAAVIHPATRLGHVHYTVANLDRQIAFYQDILGFKLHWREARSAGLGAGSEDLLRMTEVDSVRRYTGTTGLYHTAFNVPTRWQLAHLLNSIAQTKTPIQGMSNHGTHLAIYLPDAEGNGIELAWDFPAEQWHKTFADIVARRRFDTHELLRELEQDPAKWQGLDPASRVGHVHLHVADLQATERFYQDILGLEIPHYIRDAPAQFREQARFFSAGGYHHHVGTNIWNGVDAPPPPADAIGLRYYTLVLPDSAELEHVLERVETAGIVIEESQQGILLRDPASNGLLLSVKA